ncbi:MAG: trimethylamine methyltransferase family protein, partial [Desulfobacterales bacterium]
NHTMDFLRRESQFVPNLFAYRSYQSWSENPRGLAQEAEARVNDILANHEVPPLDESLQEELDRIEAAAGKALLNA